MGFLQSVDGSFVKTSDGAWVVTSDATLLTLVGPNPLASLGSAYSSSVVPSGGTPAYAFSLIDGALPNGLSLNTGSGLISGTPVLTGVFTFSILVTDAALGTQIGTFTITVTSAPAPGSGIYKIIPDQTYDELYTTIPNTTQVKIPNVFIESALFGDED